MFPLKMQKSRISITSTQVYFVSGPEFWRSHKICLKQIEMSQINKSLESSGFLAHLMPIWILKNHLEWMQIFQNKSSTLAGLASGPNISGLWELNKSLEVGGIHPTLKMDTSMYAMRLKMYIKLIWTLNSIQIFYACIHKKEQFRLMN